MQLRGKDMHCTNVVGGLRAPAPVLLNKLHRSVLVSVEQDLKMSSRLRNWHDFPGQSEN